MLSLAARSYLARVSDTLGGSAPATTILDIPDFGNRLNEASATN
jgi:hypothetical protein